MTEKYLNIILDKLLLKLHSEVSLVEGKTLMVHHYCFTFYIFFQVSIKYPNLKKIVLNTLKTLR